MNIVEDIIIFLALKLCLFLSDNPTRFPAVEMRLTHFTL